MSKHKHQHKNRGKLLPFLTFHRVTGLSSVILIVILSITGVMLNHTQRLELDKQHITRPWLLSWYGIRMPDKQLYLQVNNHWVALLGQRLYYQNTLLSSASDNLRGVVLLPQMLVIATERELFLLTLEGDLVEKITANDGLPVPISRVGQDHEHNVLLTTREREFYRSDDGLISWHKIRPGDNNNTTAQVNSHPGAAVKQLYRSLYLGNDLSLERVILDLHSGRIFAGWGIYLMDGAAVMMLLLSLSGTWIWFRRRKKGVRKTSL